MELVASTSWSVVAPGRWKWNWKWWHLLGSFTHTPCRWGPIWRTFTLTPIPVPPDAPFELKSANIHSPLDKTVIFFVTADLIRVSRCRNKKITQIIPLTVTNIQLWNRCYIWLSVLKTEKHYHGDYWSLYADIVLLPVLLNNNNDRRTLYGSTIFVQDHDCEPVQTGPSVFSCTHQPNKRCASCL